MSRAWLILTASQGPPGELRVDLKPGLTMLGGPRADVRVEGSGLDCVHLWSEPPKLIFVGGGEAPRVNGQAAQEMGLRGGDRIEWHGLTATFGYDDGQAQLEEVKATPALPATAKLTPAPSPAAGSGAARSPGPWRWLKAGLVAELALGDREVLKRWQQSVTRGEFEPESAARDLLASAPGLADDDPRLAERSTRLMRDLLMSSVTRSPMRQVRKAARTGVAFVLVQFMILAIFTALVLCGLLFIHTRLGHSIDAFLERINPF